MLGYSVVYAKWRISSPISNQEELLSQSVTQNVMQLWEEMEWPIQSISKTSYWFDESFQSSPIS